jgi:Putative zinc-finger
MVRTMSSDACQTTRLELGTYLFGALDASDRARVAAHLDGCPACRDELAGLAPLAGVLARIPDEALIADAPAEPGRAERLLAEIARMRRRRRYVAAGLAAACVVAAGGFVGARDIVSPAGGPSGIVIAGANASSHVSGRATLIATPEGTSVVVGVTGVRPGTRCQLIVIGRNGRREIAATWQANYEGMATVTGASALTPGQIRELVVAAHPGQALVVLAPARPATRAAGAA